jgi:hypothetical protein
VRDFDGYSLQEKCQFVRTLATLKDYDAVESGHGSDRFELYLSTLEPYFKEYIK